MRREEDQPQSKTFGAGVDFIRRNHTEDNWFFADLKHLIPTSRFFPSASLRISTPNIIEITTARCTIGRPMHRWKIRGSKLSICGLNMLRCWRWCDAKLGDVLDLMDELEMWEDTLLVVWTDHGFLLSEHDCWAKMWMPFYEEVAHTPFFVWDPRCGKKGERRKALVQPSIDLGPDVAGFFSFGTDKGYAWQTTWRCGR